MGIFYVFDKISDGFTKNYPLFLAPFGKNHYL